MTIEPITDFVSPTQSIYSTDTDISLYYEIRDDNKCYCSGSMDYVQLIWALMTQSIDDLLGEYKTYTREELEQKKARSLPILFAKGDLRLVEVHAFLPEALW